MISVLINIEKKDKEIINYFIEDGLDYVAARMIKTFNLITGLKNVIKTQCSPNEIDKLTVYIIAQESDDWWCAVKYLTVNAAKYNLIKEIDFLKNDDDGEISKEEFQKKFPEIKFQTESENNV